MADIYLGTTTAEPAQPLKPIGSPSMFNYHLGIDATVSSGMATVKAFMQSGLNNCNGVSSRRTVLNRRKTYDQNLSEIADHASKAVQSNSDGLANARSELAASTVNAEKALVAKVGLKEGSKASEIRSVFRAMKPAERQAKLSEASQKQDREILGAIVGQNELLHGCDPKLVSALHDDFSKTVAPAEYAALQEHHKVNGYLDNLSIELLSWNAKAFEGTQKYANERRTAEALLASYGQKFEA